MSGRFDKSHSTVRAILLLVHGETQLMETPQQDMKRLAECKKGKEVELL